MSFVILFAFACCHFCHRSNCFAASFLLVCKWQFEKTNQIQYCTWFLLRFRTAIAEEEMGHIYKNSTNSMRLINLLDYHMNWLGNEQQTLEMYTKRNIHLSWHTIHGTLWPKLIAFPFFLFTRRLFLFLCAYLLIAGIRVSLQQIEGKPSCFVLAQAWTENGWAVFAISLGTFRLVIIGLCLS